MSIDVVLVRPGEPGPQAIQQLAAAIAARYGVPVDALVQRLNAGSFRVKSGADQETAHRYLRDLQAMGAVCELRDTATGELWKDPSEEAQGLAAASGTFAQDLGALGEGNLSLATLDGGSGDTRPPPISETYNLKTPPAGIAAIPLDREAEMLEPAPPADQSFGDAFAPPTAEAGEEELMLAVDPRAPTGMEEDGPPAPRTMAPEMTDLPAGASGAMAMMQSASPEKPRGPSIGEQIAGLIARMKHGLAERSRGAFVAGVGTALVVGFLAAHVVGVFQETDAYSSVRKDLLVSYGDATDPDSHAALGSLRSGAQALIDSRQRKIAITGMLVWLVIAAAIAALWFRAIPWQRLAPQPTGAAPGGPPPAQLVDSSSSSSSGSSSGGSSP